MDTRSHLILLVAALLLVSGCATHVTGGKTTVKNDIESPTITVIGPYQRDDQFGGTARRFFIQTTINRQTHKVAHELYVWLSYVGGQRSYQTAVVDRGPSLLVSQVAQQVLDCISGSCTRAETVTVALPDSLLKTHAQSGFQIELKPRSGESVTLDVTQDMLAKQLAAVSQAEPRAAGVEQSTFPQPSIVGGHNPAPTTPSREAAMARLGLQAVAIDPQDATAMHLPTDYGLLVIQVTSGSPASQLGLAPGDVLLALNGAPLRSTGDLSDLLNGSAQGSQVTFHVWKPATENDLSLKL